MNFDNPLLQDLARRGLVAQVTAEQELAEHLSGGARVVYCGFDPTADSLHIGSLVPLLAMRRFQLAGHKPVLLVGGATGLIGDPSFKSAERILNTADVVALWVDKLKAQVSRFVDLDAGTTSAIVVNNLDWMADVSVLDFLRDVGKYFSVNQMIQKESVKQRLDREGAGISFTEFSYMLLQSYDFAQLNARYACSLQIGGSDQWGNITGGIDLTRRMNRQHVYGLTLPLVTKSDGTKFGKTESGTIWLDGARTSPYSFYQFWLGVADADVYRFLRFFTFLSSDAIDAIEANDAARDGKPEAQRILACELTCLVHGGAGLAAAERISTALFSGELAELSVEDIEQLRLDGLPSSQLVASRDFESPLTGLLTECGLAKNGKQVKDALERAAVTVNGRAISWEDNMRAGESFASGKALYGRFFIVRLGKRNYHLFELLAV